MAYKEHQLRPGPGEDFTDEHCSLSYTVAGDGPPVILIHGLASSRHDWESLAPALAGAGYRAYQVDLPGHGKSTRPQLPELYRVRSVSAVLEHWIDALGLDEPPVLIGHSLGGYLSLAYCLEHPERVHRSVLIDPFYSPQQLSPVQRLFNQHPRISARGLRVLPEWMCRAVLGWDTIVADEFPPEARRQIATDLKRASPYVMYTAGTVQDLTPSLGKVHTPSLVIWGDRDRTLNPGSFPRLVAALPDAAGRVVPGSGHQPHISRAAVVNEMILAFLRNGAKRPDLQGRAVVDGDRTAS